MTNIDVKTVGEVIKSFAPTEEHRRKFGRTFAGSLLGQATVAVGMLVLYLFLVVVLTLVVGKHLTLASEQLGPVWFWAILTAPLILIVLFQILPAFWRAQRERRLKRSAIGGDLLLKPGAFRLHPYGEADRDIFKRLDGADVTLLNWLRSTEVSLLYLSGASGVGKSSLLAADILPTLRDNGWAIVETRLFGDPVECLRTVLLKAKGIFTRKPAAGLPARELLTKAAEVRVKAGAPPLLIVIDQFEEFLILQKEGEPVPFLAFIADLANRPIEGLRLLLVFRSDYRPLVFKLGLPSLTAGRNWQEVMPYRRAEATAMLQGGGRELSPEAWDDLFRGLDRIEDTRGLYRPITLNMIGLVLERMGPTLKGDPAQLIQSYLAACITGSESRDFAKPVLNRMVSDAGARERRSESDLAALTGLRLWQVKATLADLNRYGLVRPLEGEVPVWEIAHDFLARTIGQLIGRLRPTLVQRVRPLVAPVLLVGWILAAVLTLPYWLQAPMRDLERLGALVRFGAGNALVVVFPSGIQDTTLGQARPYLDRVPAQWLHLDLSSATKITSLKPLEGLRSVVAIRVAHAKDIRTLEPLETLTNITSLYLSDMPGITSLEPLKALTKLNDLRLTDMPRISSLGPLKNLTTITHLELAGDSGITDLEPLKTLVNITYLDISETRIGSLEAVQGLTKLVKLYLGDIEGIASLEPLRGLTNLTALSLVGMADINLDPLAELENLRDLDLSRVAGVPSLEPLRELKNLKTLYIGGAKGIRSLAPLKGMNIVVNGASEELLDTMK